MKALLEYIEANGGLFATLFEIALGLFVIISLARCALS